MIKSTDVNTILLVVFHQVVFAVRDLQKATSNFTTILGQGSFGPVYKAVMATGEVVAVKVLASDSSQGEREFQTEVYGNLFRCVFFFLSV
jgi:hypothetical protein